MKAAVEPNSIAADDPAEQENSHPIPMSISDLGIAAFQVVSDTYRQSVRLDVPMVAMGLAYITIVSIFPVLALSFVIFKTVGGVDRLLTAIEPFVMQTLAEDSARKLLEGIEELVLRVDAGTLTAGGLVALTVSSMVLCHNVEKCINRVWEAKVRRPLIRRISVYWLFLTLGPLVLAVVVGLAGSNLTLRGYLPHGVLRFLLALAVFYAIYKWTPDRFVHWLSALVAALFTAGLGELARFGLVTYTSETFAREYYSKVYGGLAVVALVILLIFVAWWIILVGASLSVAVQKQVEARLPLAAAPRKRGPKPV